MKLSDLAPVPGSRKKARRLGRGESSGVGKTSGRGGKGQTARTGGGVRPGFEGGQMPLYRRLPKVGFVSRQQVLGLNRYNLVDLDVLERFDAGSTIDLSALKAKGYAKTNARRAGVKVLGTGTLTKKLTLKINAISATAKAKVEAVGGSVEIVNVR